MRTYLRLLGLGLCSVLLIGSAMLFGSQAPNPELGNYPDSDDLVADYDRYHGEHVAISGHVVTGSPLIIVLRDGAGGSLRLRVTDLGAAVQPGQRVRIFGIPQPGPMIQVIEVIVVPRIGIVYTYSISLLAGVWALVRVISHWRLDRGRLVLESRERPVSIVDTVKAVLFRTGASSDDD